MPSSSRSPQDVAHAAFASSFVGPAFSQAGASVAYLDGFVLVRSRNPHRWFNVALPSDTRYIDTKPGTIENINAFFEDDGKQRSFDVFARTSKDAAFITDCQRHGIRLQYDNQPYMMIDTPPAFDRMPHGVHIDWVPSERLGNDFLSVACSIFAESKVDGDAVRDVMAYPEFHTPRSRVFVAYKDEIPVGCAALSLHTPIAYLSWIGVTKEARQRGIADTMGRFAARWAFGVGAQAIALDSTNAGHGIYARMGFSDAGMLTKLVSPPRTLSRGAGL